VDKNIPYLSSLLFSIHEPICLTLTEVDCHFYSIADIAVMLNVMFN
jgi:hypothetical protein